VSEHDVWCGRLRDPDFQCRCPTAYLAADLDEALGEATRLADILTNCGYWG
jgi:hypothetical protein